MDRLPAALVAASVAIGVNTLALKAAELIPLETAKGGLLRLIEPGAGKVLDQLGVAFLWSAAGGPSPSSPVFQTLFHLGVGIMMGLFYAYAIEPWLRGGAWIKGWLYAVAAWLLNAAVVLPLTGEGFAGRTHLGAAGMIWFAVAHSIFFVLLALIYARLAVGDGTRGRPRPNRPA